MQNEKGYQRKHGLNKAPSWAQILSYVLVITQSVFFYALIVPLYTQSGSLIATTVLFTLTLLLLIIMTLVTSLIDPSDEMMVDLRNGGQQKYTEYCSGQNESLYCDHCYSFVKNSSRHCKSCNRCVQNFDHHCIWINNCIGKHNYRPFAYMLLAAFCNLSCFIVATVLLTVEQKYELYLGRFIAIWVICGFMIIFQILVINLSLLHVYLSCKGITTYEFIMEQRKNDGAPQKVHPDRTRNLSQLAFKDPQGPRQSQGEIYEQASQKNILKMKKSEDSIRPFQNSSELFKINEGTRVFNTNQESKEEPSPKADSEEVKSNLSKVSSYFLKNKSLKIFFESEEPFRPKKKNSNSLYLSNQLSSKNERTNHSCIQPSNFI